MGYIYILTNPSFPEYVKIGYANNVQQRLKDLNHSECTPFAFRVYATYKVEKRLTDMKVHSMIDRINPNLRSIDDVEGKKRVREFYAMSPEDAYAIFEAMAEIHGTEENLVLVDPSAKELADENTANEIDAVHRERAKPISFDTCGIAIGEELAFVKEGNKYNGEVCTVVDSKHVEYKGVTHSLSSLAAMFLEVDWNVPGPDYFQYKGVWINDIRRQLREINF